MKPTKKEPAELPEDPLEVMEGTVVTEADSAPCADAGEEGEGGAEGGEGVTKMEGEGTCEAEAREMSASESQGKQASQVVMAPLGGGREGGGEGECIICVVTYYPQARDSGVHCMQTVLPSEMLRCGGKVP